jgi:hypothetical protein
MLRINSLLFVVITVLIVSPIFAQNNDPIHKAQITEKQKIEMAVKNYKNALESDNLGMIESATINIMKLKYRYPDYDYSSLIKPLESLQTNDKSKSIRFMSYIVKNYLIHPERYAWMEKAQIEFDKDFFVAITDKVDEQVDE